MSAVLAGAETRAAVRTVGADRRSWWAAVVAIAATYGYFLIFAEFALLELIQAVAPDRLRLILGGLGVGGIGGAMFGAWWFAAGRQRAQLSWSFAGCAGAAALALVAGSAAALAFVALAVGGALGCLTVTMASSLRAATGGRRLGLAIGTGTGLAYAVSNLPMLFQATAVAQTIFAMFITAAASWAPLWMRSAPAGEAAAVSAGDFGLAGVARWVVALLALVWMDSAAFYVIQHTAALRAVTWGSASALLGNAGMHLVAALAAGALLDCGRREWVTVAGVLSLAVACLLLNGSLPIGAGAAVWFYTAGVSGYSVVLVEYPARSGRPVVAAVVFAVAGWMGSALGIGMAQDLAGIPVLFVAIAGAAVLVALLSRSRAVVAMVIMVAAVLVPRASAGEAEAAILRGREVYMSEGCIHCHSQFLRSRVARDAERWGPGQTLEEALAPRPPLFGTRRQGPDLLRVGNRRTPEWNRLHLIAPQAISPGSRMPSYAHLFRGTDTRGDDLVAYLASLGAGTEAERQMQIAAWRPAARNPLPAREAERRFRQLCAPCHGPAGRGDGPVVARLSLRPPDWSRDEWRRVPSDGDLELALSRVIKFGLPGSPMAGHEYLPDADIVGLAQYVRSLHKRGGGGASVTATR